MSASKASSKKQHKDHHSLLEVQSSDEGKWESGIGVHPAGVPIGMRFNYRVELIVCGIHSKVMAGIDFKKDSAAYAVVLSGTYRGDEDRGNTFTYCGEGGGGDGKNNKKDQEWKGGNNALLKSMKARTPVRVVRGIGNRGKGHQFNTTKHYVYDGLYLVKNAWSVIKDGYKRCMFKFDGVVGEYTVSNIVPGKP